MPRHFTCFRISRVALALVCGPLVPGRSPAQDIPCDKGLEGLARGPLGYTRRGDRCEGVYAQEVAGTPLWLASLTQGFENYDLTSNQPLRVEWDGPDSGTVLLRAQGIKHDLYYRMDTARPADSHFYRWPSDLLAAQHIAREDIGMLGWTLRPIGGVERQVLLPLRITQGRSPETTEGYELLLFPAVELKEVYLTLTAVAADGGNGRVLQQGKPLRYGSYQPDTPVEVILPRPSEPGIYHAEIGAEIATGGSTTLEFWFYHAAPAPR